MASPMSVEVLFRVYLREVYLTFYFAYMMELFRKKRPNLTFSILNLNVAKTSNMTETYKISYVLLIYKSVQGIDNLPSIANNANA